MTTHRSPVDSPPDPLDGHEAALAGQSLTAQTLRRAAAALARSDVNLLIRGEAGTGKCVWAEAINRQSGRSDRPFRVLRLAGLSADRAEAALRRDSIPAGHGRTTLYLEAIDVLPLPLQQCVLETLVAASPGRVRIIAGSRCSLVEQVRFGRFSAALYHRLAAVELTIPSLRDRCEDIADIAERCVHDWSVRTGSAPPILTDAALTELRAHTWPGNVKELARTLEIACASAPERPLTAPRIRAALNGRLRTRAQVEVTPLRDLERDYICATLARCGGNRALTARRLGIGRSTLIRKLKALGLESPEPPIPMAAPGRELLQSVAG